MPGDREKDLEDEKIQDDKFNSPFVKRYCRLPRFFENFGSKISEQLTKKGIRRRTLHPLVSLLSSELDIVAAVEKKSFRNPLTRCRLKQAIKRKILIPLLKTGMKRQSLAFSYIVLLTVFMAPRQI